MEPERRNYYIDEQLGHAVNYLATGHGRIKERLEGIAATRIGILAVRGAELFPEPLRQLAESVFQRLNTTEPLGNEGSYAAAIRALTEDEASELASDIVSLQFRHEKYFDERAR